MYNRYIPSNIPEYSPQYSAEQQGFVPDGGEKSGSWLKNLLSARENLPWRGLFQQSGGDPLDSLLKSLKLDGVDSGDILLVLLILFLLIEGEDQWELIITLGLLLIMGLAEGQEPNHQE